MSFTTFSVSEVEIEIEADFFSGFLLMTAQSSASGRKY